MRYTYRILKTTNASFVALIELHKSDLMPSDGEIAAMEAFISVMKLMHGPYIRSYFEGEIGNPPWEWQVYGKPRMLKQHGSAGTTLFLQMG